MAKKKEKTRILIVDDEEPIRSMLGELLTGHGNECTLAGDAAEAREALKKQDFALILSDVKMPGESGIDLIRHVQKEYPDTAVIMATAVDKPETAATALATGAYGYMIKPFKTNEVIINVVNALYRRELEIQNRFHRENLENLVKKRTEALIKTLQDFRGALDGIVQAMGLTVELKDPYTAGHQKRVAGIATAIAGEIGLSESRVEGVRMAGLIHDIGKIAVPSDILNKPGRITNNEYEIIKSHSQVGYDILKNIAFPWPISQIVHQHHERMDGSGYPQGLAGEDILLEARILAVTDVVEAMASHRPYRPALGVERALDEIGSNGGVLYDADVVNVCVRLFEEKDHRVVL